MTTQITETPPQLVWESIREELVGFVTKRVENRDVAQDIVHDVLERLQRAAPGTIHNPQAWLYRAARNATVDYYRLRRSNQPLEVVGDIVADDLYGSDPGPNAASRELAACLRPLMEQLPDIYRVALQKVDLDGLTHREAASIEGVSTSGMKSRVQRGRTKLAELLTSCCSITTDTTGAINDYHNPDCTCGGTA